MSAARDTAPRADDRPTLLRAEGLGKSFVLHLQGGVRIPVLRDAALAVRAGECVALSGPSGAGKSTLMRALFGNYHVDSGQILVSHHGGMVDIARADPRTVLAVRRDTLGYVSQFLRVVPRVAALDIVAEAARNRGSDAAPGLSPDDARARAAALLDRLRIPARLHALPPATFSGGEQQRVNLARGFIGGHPILLLDEPTASLDDHNRDTVIAMMREAKARGAALVGIFHDSVVRDAIADRLHVVTPLQDSA